MLFCQTRSRLGWEAPARARGLGDVWHGQQGLAAPASTA